MTIKINYQQLPLNLARNIILEDNPYKDDTSFVGQMLKHSSWNDMEYFKLEDGFLKYIDENKSGYKPEVLPNGKLRAIKKTLKMDVLYHMIMLQT